ncbi:MAG: hypothetical protein HXX20_11540 [Chloroflexi bacterium]|nr:hypothetical protein [Chloroflexota bacterium]
MSKLEQNMSKLEQKLKDDFLAKLDFIKLLLACSGMAKRASRDNLLGGVRKGELVAKVARNDTDIMDVANVVETLLDYAGALEELISFVQRLDAGSIQFGSLQDFLGKLAQQIDLAALILKAKLSEKQLQLAYEATGRDLVNKLPKAINLSERLRNLADIPFGMFEFTLRLAATLPNGRAKQALEKWVATVAVADEEEAEIRAIREKLIAEQQKQQTPTADLVPYLLLKVEEHHNEKKGRRELMLTGVWLKPVHGKVEPLGEKPQPINPKNFGEFFDKLREEKIANATEASEKLVVEIFLPPELLIKPQLNFEWFQIDGGKCPLGLGYNVVYRYSGRGNTYQSAWERKSKLLTNGATWKKNTQWCCGVEHTHWQLDSGTIYHDDDYVFLGGSLALDTKDTKATKASIEVVKSLESKALPAFLWFRQVPKAPAKIDAQLSRKIRWKGISELPTLLKELRRDVRNKPDEDNYHLTLLWDDFARQIPPSTPLVRKL